MFTSSGLTSSTGRPACTPSPSRATSRSTSSASEFFGHRIMNASSSSEVWSRVTESRTMFSGTMVSLVPIFQSRAASAADPASGKYTRKVLVACAIWAALSSAGFSSEGFSSEEAAVELKSTLGDFGSSSPSNMTYLTYTFRNSLIIGSVVFRLVYVMSPPVVSKTIRCLFCPSFWAWADARAHNLTESSKESGSSVLKGLASPAVPDSEAYECVFT
mmetsp:Transcript_38135/g.55955  ORF Transcript_38135/g.55955 Transcript_38135/m.55955 type:complete len:217 (+) Transcript_38135:643-1293(+)